ncbi:MAG: hypothetical protein FD152_2115 [Xanthobacteraceae bacterium]|nr:MAG: hypothetical protein FD152_2115 [Xanthobacteraceae bacterium]
MARGLSTDVLNALRAERVGERWMLRFDFDEADGGPVGFWSGSVDTTFEGLTYRPGGVLELDVVSYSQGLAQQLSVGIRTLADRAIPDAADVFARIETIAYIGRPVTLYFALLDAEGRVVDVTPEWSGKCGPVEHDRDTAKGEVSAVMTLESDSFDHGRKETATFSPALFRSANPGDAFFDSVAVTRSIKIKVGR